MKLESAPGMIHSPKGNFKEAIPKTDLRHLIRYYVPNYKAIPQISSNLVWSHSVVNAVKTLSFATTFPLYKILTSRYCLAFVHIV